MKTGIEIRSLDLYEEMEQAEELQRIVWPGSEIDIIPAHLSMAISHNGGAVLGAFDQDKLVGYLLGFLGTDAQSPDRMAMTCLKHWSHQVGVHPAYRDCGIGFALKHAQREKVLKQGIRLVTWTYDPLLSLNAHLNIRRLGAVCDTYLQCAYGEMRDSLNAGVESDRFQVDWWVSSPRVSSRFEDARKPLDMEHYLEAGAEKVNPAVLGDGGQLHPSEAYYAPQGIVGLVEIPPDYHALKQFDLGLAQRWREHTRDVFRSLFTAGYLITDFLYLKGEVQPRSYYVLTHGEGKLG
ncbi:MAG: GNAT family N-acetyltransferase [Anaerolineales bacterium]|nr:GNAT family N-acetyltransferase [Anaerolineales bacterium]MCK5634658.1 GNAT family N-acetyltransferase [Anaerolineales bacterium]